MSFIQVRSGNKIYLDNLSENKYILEDIAYSLAYQVRFNGYGNRFYSVAQHCINVTKAMRELG